MFLLDEAPKRIENRGWTPPRALIGQFIALHGGRLPKTPAEFREVREALDWVNDEVWDGDEESSEVLGQPELLQLCTAGIFAVARLSEVVSSSRDPWFVGDYGWVLTDFVQIDPPVPHKGAQGLWELEPEALALVRERWAAARQPQAAPAAPAERQPVVDTVPALTGQVCGTCVNGAPGEYPHTVECLLGWERQDGVLRPVLGGKFEWIPVPQGHGGLPAPIMHPEHSCIAVIGNGHPGWATK